MEDAFFNNQIVNLSIFLRILMHFFIYNLKFLLQIILFFLDLPCKKA